MIKDPHRYIEESTHTILKHIAFLKTYKKRLNTNMLYALQAGKLWPVQIGKLIAPNNK